jgi:MFS superfamily sulfate permease-like transporter
VLCLTLPLELGILVGVVINIIFILYHAARPKFSVEMLKVSVPTIAIDIYRIHLV